MHVDINENRGLELSEIYNGVSVKTDVGTFAICQRDGGIEIRLADGPWYRWVEKKGPEMLALPPGLTEPSNDRA